MFLKKIFCIYLKGRERGKIKRRRRKRRKGERAREEGGRKRRREREKKRGRNIFHLLFHALYAYNSCHKKCIFIRK